MYPKLVTNLIDWYIWKGKNGSINREYVEKHYITYIRPNEVWVVNREYNFYYNFRNLGLNSSPINRMGRGGMVKQYTPRNYRYSSGYNNPCGYNNI